MSNDSGTNWGQVATAGAGVAGGILGMIGQKKRAKKAHSRNKELMGIQFENQQALNQQGHELQMKAWRDTGYEAQMKMMKDAGLNPSLMYGMSGGGGQTTGSQGGGSASGNSSHAPMDIGASVQASLMAAQTAKLLAEADEIKGRTGLQENQKSKLNAETVKLTEEGIKLNMENDVKWKTLDDEVKKIKMEALNEELETQLNKLNKELTEEQIKELSHRIWQNWVKAGSFATGALSGVIGQALKGLFKKASM